VPVKMQFYDTKGAFLKEGSMGKIVTIKGINTPTYIEMKNAQTGRATILELNNIEYDTGLSDDIFTQRYMQRGK
jgi:outer membrane lipoprotein-sorting protein